MTDTEIVPRNRDREPADRAPLVDAQLADELLARAQSDGVELLGPDGLLSQVTKAVLEGALAEEMTEHRGIGRGIVEAYLQEGASVAFSGRSEASGHEAMTALDEPDRTLFVAGDATERSDIEALIDRAAERFGKVDVLVNNAGGADNHAPVAELTDEAMDLALRWNLWLTFYGMRHALKHYMIPQEYGRIINISSVEGKEGRPGIATYVTAKHAIHGLTKSAAQEVGTLGITVRCSDHRWAGQRNGPTANCRAVLPRHLPKLISRS